MVIGDIVYLNSGSPKLTITWVIDGWVTVSWVYEGKILHEEFPMACFTVTNPNPESK